MIERRIPSAARCLYAYKHFDNTKNIFLIAANNDDALDAYHQLLFFEQNEKKTNRILFFPSLDTNPYDKVSPAARIISKRADILTKLSQNNSNKIIVTAAQNLLNKLPTKDIFINSSITIDTNSKMSIRDLSEFLINNGYNRVCTAQDSGEFTVRGEIIDLVNYNNNGYRINFGWDNIESIKEFDIYSQLSKGTLPKLELSSATEITLNKETIQTFKDNFLKLFGVNHITSPLYESITSRNKFYGYEHLLPLFYKKTCNLYDFVKNYQIIYDNLSVQAIIEHENTYHEFYKSRLLSNKTNPESFYFATPVDQLIENSRNIRKILSDKNNILLSPGTNQEIYTGDKFTQSENIHISAKIEKKSEYDKLFEVILSHKKKLPIIFCNSHVTLEKIKKICQSKNHLTQEINQLSLAKEGFINLSVSPFSQGFITEKYLFITEKDIFCNKINIKAGKSSKKKLENILTELDNISEGELIVHKEHGIGVFSKIETINIKNTSHDCLKIIYAGDDILYVPIEAIDQIKKYGQNEAQLDKLGNLSWQKRKSKLSKRIKDIAKELIATTAQRSLLQNKIIKFDQTSYEEFSNKFPYTETEDQISCINDIKSDLQKGHLMDRLVCGDVGFGKTEVAMRAAFMVINDINDDLPQIAIISPTTILCKQHYVSFLKRFEGVEVNIAQLSRLTKGSEAKKIKEEIANGKINIIIATHALLAASIKFKNLRMIIIDEEQHFGVKQKEHLKNLKTDIHVLSLSATPIPRTLQMSMLDIKELSIIATPPVDRIPVQTNIIPFDGIMIRDALMREHARGGLSFYVVPRIKDIEWVERQLNQYVPELTYKIAHGQMAASKIDKIMNEFYDAKFDILLSTTIIESGIDIPIANTIIVHKPNMLGLSRLYQLRGRVGRGKIKSYAYLTLHNSKKITKNSLQRLDVLQNINSLGAGFTIASHDMDLRGFGNLIGEEQAGNIKEVGAELYQEMLSDEIHKLKNKESETNTHEFTPLINLGISILIPSNYIEGSSLRLAIYRRAANLQNQEEIKEFRDEMIDRFGPIPSEFDNLLNTIDIKNSCIKLKIAGVDTGPNGFLIKFHEKFDVSEMVMKFISKYPQNTKIKPDNKLVFIKKLSQKNILSETEKLLTLIRNVK